MNTELTECLTANIWISHLWNSQFSEKVAKLGCLKRTHKSFHLTWLWKFLFYKLHWNPDFIKIYSASKSHRRPQIPFLTLFHFFNISISASTAEVTFEITFSGIDFITRIRRIKGLVNDSVWINCNSGYQEVKRFQISWHLLEGIQEQPADWFNRTWSLEHSSKEWWKLYEILMLLNVWGYRWI